MDYLTRTREGFRTIEGDATVKERALQFLQQWLTAPEYAAYRPQLHWLIENAQWPGLLDRFAEILPFGTGGRRGAVGIGPNRMNSWTLTASVQGHCEYLKESFPGVVELKVVLAYDVRRFEDVRQQYNPALPNPVLHLSSRDLAQLAACVYAANGIHAWILPADSAQYLATPELSYAIRMLQAHGGLNVSASHNPPDDNGGKFYDDRGAQPIPPEDQMMADLVEEVTTIRNMTWREAQTSGRLHYLDETTHRGYIDLCRKQSLIATPKPGEFKVVFTPLHGVGGFTAGEVLTAQGFRVIAVPEQATPDGRFPNVTKSPNPEVAACFDRAIVVAKQHEADLILATDPDADRLGGMVRDPGGNYVYLTGNQIAALLTHFKLAKLKQLGRLPASPIVITTAVTTGQITRIARHFRAQVVDNLLVGFKYMAEVLRQLETTGHYEDVSGTPADFVIATEESHGAMLMPQLRDKDAAAAALVLAEMALEQKRRGETLLDYLARLQREFGYFRNEGRQVVMRGLEGRAQMARMLDAIRAAPFTEIASNPVTEFEDLRDENGRMGPLKGGTDAASRNVLLFTLGERARIALRPSGTEPKAKVYLETRTAPCPAHLPAAAWWVLTSEADALLERLAKEFVSRSLALIGLDTSAVG
jgi:phosphoglucomutase/phosphomannomutase